MIWPEVLWLNSAGQTRWQRVNSNWVAHAKPGPGPWVLLADLPEETFIEVAVPRLFGGDRKAFVERQLAARFPETRYRTLLPELPQGGLMDRLAPPRQAMVAVEASDKIDAALAGQVGACAGVWSLSAVVANAALSLKLKGSLLVAIAEEANLRIVYLAQGRAQLARLVPGVAGAQAIANELRRTLRHLENTKVLERGGKPVSVWLLGAVEMAADAINKDRLSLLRHDPQWRDLILDRVARYPAGQLASVAQRVEFLSGLWSLRIRQSIAATGLITVGLLAWQFAQWNEVRMRVNEINGQIAILGSESTALEERIASFGVSPELVRMALELDRAELQQTPSFEGSIATLSQAVSQATDLRIHGLEWNLMEVGQQPCVQLASAPPAQISSAEEATTPHPAGHVAELRFKSVFPSSWTLQRQEREGELLSQRINASGTLKVLVDPVSTARMQSVSLDGAKGTPNDALKEWCLVVKMGTTSALEKQS